MADANQTDRGALFRPGIELKFCCIAFDIVLLLFCVAVALATLYSMMIIVVVALGVAAITVAYAVSSVQRIEGLLCCI